MCMFVCTYRNHSNRDNIRFYHTMPIPLRQSLSLNLEIGWQTASPRNLMVLLHPQSSELQIRAVNLFLVLCGLGFELKSSHLCCKYSYPQSHLQPPMLLFWLVIFIKALGSQKNWAESSISIYPRSFPPHITFLNISIIRQGSIFLTVAEPTFAHHYRRMFIIYRTHSYILWVWVDGQWCVSFFLEDHMHYCHYPEAHWALSPSTSLSLIPGNHRIFHCLQSFQFSIFPPCCHCCYAGKAVLQREQFRGEPHPRDSGTVYIKIRPIDRSKAQLLFSV